jgi:hypothetical protein
MLGVAVSAGGAALPPAHSSADAGGMAHSNAITEAVANRAAPVTFRPTFRLESFRALDMAPTLASGA